MSLLIYIFNKILKYFLLSNISYKDAVEFLIHIIMVSVPWFLNIQHPYFLMFYFRFIIYIEFKSILPFQFCKEFRLFDRIYLVNYLVKINGT